MSRGVYVRGVSVQGGTCSGGYVLEPTDISLNILNIN